MSSPTYVILGATGGIGLARCEQLTKRGAAPLLCRRDPDRLSEPEGPTGGVRVNWVAPGRGRTPLTQRLAGTTNTLVATKALHPLGRVGDPAQAAAAMAWLLDPASARVSAPGIGVDGGLATLRGRTRP